jgi:hypothetical protein
VRRVVHGVLELIHVGGDGRGGAGGVHGGTESA